MKIIINYNFTSEKEVSYGEGLELIKQGKSFCTNVLDFFNFDINPKYEIIVLDKNGFYISRNELIDNPGKFCSKEIRHAHNIHKMLCANTFTWRQYIGKEGDIVNWSFPDTDNYPESLRGKTFEEEIAAVDLTEKEYCVYAPYGQDKIPYDKCRIYPKID